MPLPIDAILPELTAVLADHTNAVVQAPPGAGKTTQIPLSLLNAPWLDNKKIIMLEPRRLAARAAARYMAHLLGEQVGETVGYRVRLDSQIGPGTRIEIVTEGVLTRLLQADPALEAYAVVIFDEFHERHLQADLGLALCLDAQQGLREDLRLVVMSATLDGEAVSRLLGNAPILTSEGRSFPVMVRYQSLGRQFARDRNGFLSELVQVVRRITLDETGSLLVFLPGVSEIRRVYQALQTMALDAQVILIPLYGQLTAKEQDAAINPAPPGKRKLVLATAIAESSLTIEGVRVVIDAGLMRQPRFDPNTGLTRLVTLPVTQAAAAQRCGRAGRVQEGVCYRLWSQGTHLLATHNPEILDADLAPLLLELAQWGVRDPSTLRWLDNLPQAHINQARELLQLLKALDAHGGITAHGREMAQWAMHPRLAHMLIRARELGVGALACDVAAILSDRDVLRADTGRQSDLQLRIDALHNKLHGVTVNQSALRQARDAAAQWRKQLNVKCEARTADMATLGSLLAFAYPDRIAQRRGDSTRYLLSNGRGARLDDGDLLSREKWIVAAELDGTGEARIFLAASIPLEALIHDHAELIKTKTVIQWDEMNACVQSSSLECLGGLVLREDELKQADTDAVVAAMLEGIRKRGIQCLPWSDSAHELRRRIQFAHEHLDSQWPNVSLEALSDTLETWLAPYLSNMTRLTHLSRLNLTEILMSHLSYAQQQELARIAPTHLTVPSGSRIRIDYSQFPPVVAVRLQELFGLANTPSLAGGRMPLVLHLLSPARRPVQITQDLAGFWQRSYHDVKKDLKGRYPKHYWPDDPLQAVATAHAKRKPDR